MKRLVFGPRAVTEALRAAPRQINALFVDRTSRAWTTISQTTKAAGVTPIPRSKNQLDSLSGPIPHQGVVAITGDYPYLDLDGLLARATHPELLLALDQVQDVGNLGSLIRSALAFDAQGLLLCRHGAASVTAAVVRVSAGATEHAAVTRVTNLARTLASLRDQGMTIVGLDAEGTVKLAELDLTGPVVLVLGSESKGLRRLVRQQCDHLATIPIPGTIASLNVAVAGAVALYEVRRQREVGR